MKTGSQNWLADMTVWIIGWLIIGVTFIQAQALPLLTVIASDDYASESSPPGITNTGAFTFTRSETEGGSLTVYFSLTGSATPVSDYKALPNAVTFPAGASIVTLPVEAIFSRSAEPMETVILNLTSNAAYEVGLTNQATVNIWENDLSDTSIPPVVIWTDGSGAEHVYPGNFTNTVVFTIYRGGAVDQPLVVDFTLGGTAVPGLDYIGNLSGSATIAAGSSSAVVELWPIEDLLPEGYESIAVALLPTNRYWLGSRTQAVAEIIDNDPGPVPTINRDSLAMLGGRLSFKLNGLPGQTFQLYCSTNLADWEPATPIPLAAGSLFIEATNHNARVGFFYRATQP